ncbi:Transmembrane secretion effector [Leifsonia sp. 98AMF]|uniref:MFS transporter n=1 Tax=unclassified Leifsonia TaxID=2663824 RepID=UPI000879B1CD|nr:MULTISPECIES: MFS transporter [unclassified Leifsonia]SDH50833.1 Transmembrane secretion effector [Leifsonia sp. 197AMF]SDI87271.1 Transmembrane secretion effector [Leifsonia sp. 466MF]SDJ94426.1 Transmembrane secretion effector [Leifsonia sp. 157MF]SDN90699.1 Transmembrane secretion effector [Leifsonia sp. 509MF]SEN15238.1 Transmembrane secretion effector [Leifsonia sp. 467MF]
MTATATRERSPLLRRDFALVWTAGLVSDTGDWLLMIALPLFALSATGSALGASTVFLVELVPMLLVGSFLGVLVDRWDHRRTIIIVALLQGLLLLPLLAASADRMGIVYAVAAVEAVLGAIINPARQAMIPQLVGADQLARGNALIAVSDSLARLIGSPLGGLSFALWGLPGVVIADAASYLITAGLVLFVRRRPRTADAAAEADGEPAAVAERRILHEWVEGLALIARSATLRTLAGIAALAGVAQGLFLVLFLVYVTQNLGAGDTGAGIIRGVQAIGGVLGGLVTGALARRLAPRWMIGVGYLVFGTLSLVTWNLAPFTTALWVYAGLFIAMGIPGVTTATGEITLVQTTVPARALGRVIAAVTTLDGAAQAVGLLIGGLLADSGDIVPVLDVQGSLYLLCGLIGVVALRDRRGLAGSGVAAERTRLT